MKSLSPLSLCLFALPFLTGCLEDLPDPTFIDDVRILALRSSAPEIPPGESVLLDALVANPHGEDLNYHWYACISPVGTNVASASPQGDSYFKKNYEGLCQDMVKANEPWAFDLGEGESLSFEAPEGLFENADAIKAAYGFAKSLSLPNAFVPLVSGVIGLPYQINLVLSGADGTERISSKTLYIKTASLTNDSPNLNPESPQLIFSNPLDPLKPPDQSGANGDAGLPPGAADGADSSLSSCFPVGSRLQAGKHEIEPSNIPEERGQYSVLSIEGESDIPFEIRQKTESYYYAFFTTVGHFKRPNVKFPGAYKNELSLPSGSPQEADLWVVLRNGRGGVSWCHERIDIERP